jgi:Fic family protein
MTKDNLIQETEQLKSDLQALRKFDSYRITDALELNYTYESNRIEGNTLTLKETDLVINKGLTIGGKSMNEHLEAINHKEAILYIKDIVKNNLSFSERVMLDIHSLILRGIDRDNAGRYRSVQVSIGGSKFLPPQPYLVPKMMEDYFIWFNENKDQLHPIILSAELHERLVSIHPFIDGNGRTARLVMNLLLLQNGFVIVNLKGDVDSRIKYYNALEKAQTGNDKSEFINMILEEEKKSLMEYLRIIKGGKSE